MASGELGRRRRASRELKWVGAYSEARVPTVPAPNARRSLCSASLPRGAGSLGRLAAQDRPSLTH